MTCIKKIQNTEVFGSKFSSRTLTTAGDISGYSFKAVVKNIIQGKILEIAGVKNAGTINFDFSQLETLKKSTYQIEYWGDFGALGNEPFLLEEFSIVSAENATNCANTDNLNFEIKLEEITIPVTISKSINQFFLDYESLTDEQKAQLKGDAFTYEDFTPTQIAELQKPATDKLVELNALETTLTNSENLRVLNENNRISNEEIRTTNETDRIYSENSRNTNEQSRVNAENNRVTSENSRSNAENIRITAETERASNESERKTAETARVSAENTRATAETARANAETTRVNSENTRISNENNRMSAENTRVSNESGRVTAESLRVAAENARVAAELERQNKKKSFTHDILVSNWSLVSGKYEAVISNAVILVDSFVDVIPNNDSVDIVRSAQIYPSVLISAGSVKVYSKFLPSDTISVTVNVI